MTNSRLNNNQKQVELIKYRDLVIATLDYSIADKKGHFKTENFDSIEYYQSLKLQALEHFKKGRRAKLKQWFRDMTEMYIECRDLEFNKYLQDETKIEIDIFKSYSQRIDKIIEKGKIKTDNQFYEVNSLIDQLSQAEPIDNNKIEILNKILGEYEQRKIRRS